MSPTCLPLLLVKNCFRGISMEPKLALGNQFENHLTGRFFWLQGSQKIWASGLYLMKPQWLHFFVLGSQLSSNESHIGNLFSCTRGLLLLCTTRQHPKESLAYVGWLSYWEISPQSLCQCFPGKPQEDRTHPSNGPMEPIATKNHLRGSKGHAEPLALQENPRNLAFKKRESGEKKLIFVSLQLFFHAST